MRVSGLRSPRTHCGMAFQEREDRQGGICYNQFNRVRLESLWRDRLRKESGSRSNCEPSGFQMNMANTCSSGGFLMLKHSHNRMETVTEKEIKQSPQARMSLKGMDPDSLEVMAIQHMLKKPAEKYDVPHTTSQELGWLLSNPVRASTICPPRQLRGRGSSAVDPHGLRGSLLEPPIPGCLVHRPTELLAPEPAQSVVSPTNDVVLQRVRSAPHLPLGPPLGELKQLNNRKWYRPKGNCDVTHYANAFVTMNHRSPFAKATEGR